MNKAQEDAAYYAVITAPVRYDPELSSTAKLLYGELTSLCKAKGYCWATNSHFAELYGVSESTVSRLISQLERRGHIRVETVAIATGSERRIYTDVCYVEAAPEGGYAKTANRMIIREMITVKISPLTPLAVRRTAGPVVRRSRMTGPGGDSEPVDKPKPKRKRRAQRSVPLHAPERLEQFWQAYPVGGSRLKAVEAWDALAPDDALINEMARALKRQMNSRMWRDGIGIPHACRWLSNQRWTDKLPEEPRPRGDFGGWDDPEVTT